MLFPSELKYAKTDEWISVEGNIATVGVTDFAQNQLSDVVFFESLVSVGENIEKGSQFGTLESVKAAASVNAPVSGKVIQVNEDLANSPELVNEDPYGKAWMIKIEISSPAELSTLMDAREYKAYCEERSH